MRGEFDRSLPLVRQENAAGAAANLALRETLERLEVVSLPLDAADSDVCAQAARLAVQCLDVARINGDSVEGVRGAMEQFCRARHVEPPCGKTVTNHGAISRMTCETWWRGQLRKLHAKAVEGAAIQLGYVNRARDCYVSDESLARRAQQLRRNQRTLEGTLMRNEEGQEFTLAELAAKGVANKSIRRGELMTRIAGFEKIARDCGHECIFLTPTCPSRMHSFAVAGSGVIENQKYDGTTPKQAQAYLSKVFSRVRAKLLRDGLGVYGVRVAEPHHDGCPHWHFILFHEAGRGDRIVSIFRKYFLADSPDEQGALEHRCASKVIDLSAGSAAGYIAKYISKNIDGYMVGEDLFGNPALESCARVEAWAATWGIRQFQQVGGAPVGVWRELRRVKEVPEDAPEHVKAAHVAVNKIGADDFVGDNPVSVVKQASWADYTQAQGGVFVGRKYRIRMALEEETGELGRYGEPKALKPVGVISKGIAAVMVCGRMGTKLVEVLVRSVRHVWERVRGFAAAFSPPRTCVNNCTRIDKKMDEARAVSGGDGWFVSGAFG